MISEMGGQCVTAVPPWPLCNLTWEIFFSLKQMCDGIKYVNPDLYTIIKTYKMFEKVCILIQSLN